MHRFLVLLMIASGLLQAGLGSHIDERALVEMQEKQIDGMSWHVPHDEETTFMEEPDQSYDPLANMYLWAPEKQAADIDDRSPWVPNWGWNPNKMD